MVGVMLRYSNPQGQLEVLRKLSDLPQRRDSKMPGRGARRPVRRPTSVEADLMVASYESGATIRAIGSKFGFNRGTVSKVLHDAGVKTRYHQTQPVDHDTADRLLEQGYTITATAELMGVSRSMLVRARKARRQAASS